MNENQELSSMPSLANNSFEDENRTASGQPGPDADEHDGELDESTASGPDSFWNCGPEFDGVEVSVVGPERAHALLEELGPSPFERGGFPIIGFLATTYDKVTRFALEQE